MQDGETEKCRVCRHMIAPLMFQGASAFVLAPDKIVLFFRGDEGAAPMGRRKEGGSGITTTSAEERQSNGQKGVRCCRKKEGRVGEGVPGMESYFRYINWGETDLNNRLLAFYRKRSKRNWEGVGDVIFSFTMCINALLCTNSGTTWRRRRVCVERRGVRSRYISRCVGKINRSNISI